MPITGANIEMYIYKEKQSLAFILLTLFGFVLLWAVVTDAWGYSSNLEFGYGKQVYALLSRLFWVFPAICLIKRHSDSLSIGKKELFSKPVWNRPLATILIISVILSFVGMLIIHGGLWLNPAIRNPLDIIVICCVGFVEETVFRGWGYNALRGIVSEKKAVILSTLFFVLLHSPAYFVRCYRLGAMDYDTWIIQSISATVWGIVFCRLLKKSKTIWNPIIAHVVYDVFVTVFVE